MGGAPVPSTVARAGSPYSALPLGIRMAVLHSVHVLVGHIQEAQSGMPTRTADREITMQYRVPSQNIVAMCSAPLRRGEGVAAPHTAMYTKGRAK